MGCAFEDSKKISEKRRYELFEEIMPSTTNHIVVIKPFEIDSKGLSLCMKEALQEIKLSLRANEYLFDGNTSFGVDGLETMVKADGKVAEVSAASILAKVVHDLNIIKDLRNFQNMNLKNIKAMALNFMLR